LALPEEILISISKFVNFNFFFPSELSPSKYNEWVILCNYHLNKNKTLKFQFGEALNFCGNLVKIRDILI
jgi:hypothetical protein